MTCVCGAGQDHPLAWVLCTPADLDSDLAIHAVPDNDTKGHLLDANGKCWCAPWIDEEADDLIFVHNAHDQRESFSLGLRKPT